MDEKKTESIEQFKTKYNNAKPYKPQMPQKSTTADLGKANKDLNQMLTENDKQLLFKVENRKLHGTDFKNVVFDQKKHYFGRLI